MNLFEYYRSSCKQVSFIVIEVHTFGDIGAVSFSADLSSLLFITLSRLSLLGGLLRCFGAVDSLGRGLGSSGSRSFASSRSGL
jgi:hypothetical protein